MPPLTVMAFVPLPPRSELFPPVTVMVFVPLPPITVFVPPVAVNTFAPEPPSMVFVPPATRNAFVTLVPLPPCMMRLGISWLSDTTLLITLVLSVAEPPITISV